MTIQNFLTTTIVAALVGSGLAVLARVPHDRETVHRSAGPGPVIQVAPTVTRTETRTETRAISGPTDLVERIADTPERGDIVSTTDRLSRSEGQVRLEREIVRRIQRPVALRRSSLDAAFTAAGESYLHAFGAVYEWENPTDGPTEMRFVFPVPKGRGELSGFHLSIGRLDIVDSDAGGQTYSWTGTVPARGRVVTAVGYRMTGSQGYRYEPGTERMEGFELRLRGDWTPSVARGALAPAEAKERAATWRMDDLRPTAPIAVSFESIAPDLVRRNRALDFAPFALALFAFGAWALRPERGALATIMFGAGLAGIAVLSPYLPPVAAVLAGIGAAAVAGGAAIGSSRGAFVGLAGGLLAACPLLLGDATLAAWGLGLAVLAPVTRARREAPAASAAYLA